MTQNSQIIRTRLSDFKSIKFPAPTATSSYLPTTYQPRPPICTNTPKITAAQSFIHNTTSDSSSIKFPADLPPDLQETNETDSQCYSVSSYTDAEPLHYDWDKANLDITSIESHQGTYHPADDDDFIIVPNKDASTFTAYKHVDKKIHPVSTRFPDDCNVRRQITDDPLLTLPTLTPNPPPFTPTAKITEERLKILDINGDKFLTPDEERLFQHIMVMNERGIAFEDVERGTLKEEYFSPYIIPTIPHRPWEDRNIPIPPGLRDKVIEVLKLKMDAGVYEQSQSSYRSRWFVTVKKSGKLRIVHDLQPLNRIAIRDAGSVPILDDFVEGFAGRQCYTVFDLFWGFDARKIHPKSRELTAFQTPLGLLQITSLPTGFTNSPAEFQKCMVIVLQPEIPHVANIFIDDLPIKGPVTQYLDEHGKPEVLKENPGIRRFIWEHAQDVHRIMHRVAHAGATFAANKAQICRPEVLIVGQRCNADGREPDKDKIKKILNWPTPTNSTDVRRFLGLCGTVCIWIPNYSHLFLPLSTLYHKDHAFIWTEKEQKVFEFLKQQITSAPILRPIDYSSERPVILSVDSSKEAAGMILSQIDKDGRHRPARYGSIPMSERESKYSQAKLELFGLYRALRHWSLYLIGVKRLVVEVDAKYIKGMLNSPDLQPNAATNRWIQGILLFPFELVHVPAKQHKGPDALSRRPLAENEDAESDDDTWIDNIALMGLAKPTELKSIDPTLPPTNNTPVTAYCLATRKVEEDLLTQIQTFLETLATPTFPTPQKKRRFLAKATEFFIKDTKMYKRNGSRAPLLVIRDPNTKISILQQSHEKLGHKGIQAVFDLLRCRFYWPHMRADIQHHIRSCHECQIRSLKRFENPLSVSIPLALFQKIYVDIMHMPEAKGFKYIVAARDDLSGVCEARALRHATAKELAKFFSEQILYRYGAPSKVITDNGPETKEAFKKLLERHGIPHISITPYNHHANGVVERGHFVLREALIKTCQGKISEWPDHLQSAVFADRVTVSRVTGYSPYQLLHGTEPTLPLDLTEATFLVPGFRPKMSTTDLLALRIQQLQKRPDDLANAAETLRKSRFASKAQFEKRFIRRLTRDVYRPGELVLVRNTAIEMSHDRKHKARYLGPYQITERTPTGQYSVTELDGTPLPHRIVPWRLLPYILRNHPFMRASLDDSASDNTDDASSEEDSESD